MGSIIVQQRCFKKKKNTSSSSWLVIHLQKCECDDDQSEMSGGYREVQGSGIDGIRWTMWARWLCEEV